MPSSAEQRQELFERVRNSPKHGVERIMATAPRAYKSDIEFARLTLEHGGIAVMKHWAPVLRNNFDLALETIMFDKLAINELPPTIINNAEFMVKQILEGYITLADIPEKYKNLTFIRRGIAKTPSIYARFGPEIRDNFDITMIAVNLEGNYLQYASDRLKANEEICRKAIESNGYAIQHCYEEFRMRPDMCTTAIETTGIAYKFIPSEIKLHYEISRLAIEMDILNAKYLPPVFYDDIDFISNPMWIKRNIVKYLPTESKLLANIEFLGKVIEINPQSVIASLQQEAIEPLRPKITSMLSTHSNLFTLGSSALRGDLEFAILVLNQKKYIYHAISSPLNENILVIEVALRNDPFLFPSLPQHIRNKHEVIMLAMLLLGKNLQHIQFEQKTKDICLAAVSNYGRALQYVPRALKLNSQILHAALKNDGDALRFPHKSTKNSRIFARLSEHRHLASDRLQFSVSDAYFWLDPKVLPMVAPTLPPEIHMEILEYFD